MIVKALQLLRPKASWSMNGDDYDNLVWTDTVQTKPTKQEVEDKIAELLADFQAKQYQRQRVYPSLGEQLDMLWHAIDTGALNKTSDFYTAIKAIKDKYPKA